MNILHLEKVLEGSVKNWLKRGVLLLLLTALTACGGGFGASAPKASGNMASASVSISLPAVVPAPAGLYMAAPTSITGIVVRVTAADMDPISVPVDLGTLTAIIDVPAGNQRTFSVSVIYNGTTMVGIGTATLDISPLGAVDVPITVAVLTRTEVAQMMLNDIMAAMNSNTTAAGMLASVGHYFHAGYLHNGSTKANQFTDWKHDPLSGMATSGVATLVAGGTPPFTYPAGVVAHDSVELAITDSFGTWKDFMWVLKDTAQFWYLYGNRQWLQFDVEPYARVWYDHISVPLPNYETGVHINVRDPFGYAAAKGVNSVAVFGPLLTGSAGDAAFLVPEPASMNGNYYITHTDSAGGGWQTWGMTGGSIPTNAVIPVGTTYMASLHTVSAPPIGTPMTWDYFSPLRAAVPSPAGLVEADFPTLVSPITKAAFVTALNAGTLTVTWTNPVGKVADWVSIHYSDTTAQFVKLEMPVATTATSVTFTNTPAIDPGQGVSINIGTGNGTGIAWSTDHWWP